jgi:hypothetical protein
MVFSVSRNYATGASSIGLRAIVNHLLLPQDNFWLRQVDKSLWIDKMLYTKSNCLLRVHGLEKLDRILNLNLNCASSLGDVSIDPIASPVFRPPAPQPISGKILSV